MPAKKQTTRIGKWYKSDDEKVHFVRRRKVYCLAQFVQAPKPSKLRKSIAPGQVVILLAGRFRGKRVVFLKQLKSGLLLVTGPHKVNGVPLKRVNQAYVAPTKTRVEIKGVDVNAINDEYFARTKIVKRKNENGFWAKKGEVFIRINVSVDRGTIEDRIDQTLEEERNPKGSRQGSPCHHQKDPTPQIVLGCQIQHWQDNQSPRPCFMIQPYNTPKYNINHPSIMPS